MDQSDQQMNNYGSEEIVHLCRIESRDSARHLTTNPRWYLTDGNGFFIQVR